MESFLLGNPVQQKSVVQPLLVPFGRKTLNIVRRAAVLIATLRGRICERALCGEVHDEA